MKFPFLSNVKNNNIVQQWLPSCHQPRTHSFRTDDNNNTLFKTINSAYLDSITEADETLESGDDSDDNLPLETVVDVRGLRSDRLFFEPGETSSIMEEATKRSEEEEDDDGDGDGDELPFKESVVLSMETRDPYFEFKESMEEMVEAQGIKDWEGLEQLLFWYLRANGKCNHGYIIGAFVDLLVARISIDSNPKSHNNFHSPSSPLSFYSSSSSSSTLSSSEDCSSTMIPCVSSSLVAEKEIIDDNSRSLLAIKGNGDDAPSSASSSSSSSSL